MGVEEEGRDAETDDGDPEVDDVGNPDAHGDVEQQHQRPHTEVDRRSSETRAKSQISAMQRRLTTEC